MVEGSTRVPGLAEHARIRISVVIPTYRRRDVLQRCLAALAAQTLSKERFEILLSDNGSDPLVAEDVRGFGETQGISVTYRCQENRGTPARNESIVAARGDLVLIINDDTIVTPGVLEEHLLVHDEHPDEPGLAVLGRVTIAPEVADSLFAKLHLDASYALLEGQTEVSWRSFYTCNISVRRAFLLEHGLFDESLPYLEDTELGERLSHHGLRILYRPAALGYHLHDLKEDDYLTMGRRSGAALARWYRNAPQRVARLAQLGLQAGMPRHRRWRLRMAEVVVDRFALPPLLWCARVAARRNERLALALYRKVYQSIRRVAIRTELARLAEAPAAD